MSTMNGLDVHAHCMNFSCVVMAAIFEFSYV